MFACFKNLKTKLRIKISLMKEKRRRRNDSLYPRIIPQNLSEIDLGEELTRVPSLISLQEAEQRGENLSRVPSLTSLQSNSSFAAAEQPLAENMQLPAPQVSEEEISEPSDQEILWPIDTARNVQLLELRLSVDSKLSGTVMAKNLAYHKNIFIRWTVDNWATHQDLVASYDRSSEGFTHDWFSFSTESPLLQKGEDGVCVELAVAYQVNEIEFRDNNQGDNFGLLLN